MSLSVSSRIYKFVVLQKSQESRVDSHMVLCVILSVCPHDKTKMAEIEIAKLGTEIVHHDTSPIN